MKEWSVTPALDKSFEIHAADQTMGGPGGVVSHGGDAAYKTLKNNVNSKWIHDPGLRKLNFGLGLMFASAAANGYDGSLMNGLLAIPRCELRRRETDDSS